MSVANTTLRRRTSAVALGSMLLAPVAGAAVSPASQPLGVVLDGWSDYQQSGWFAADGPRCATPTPAVRAELYGVAPTDDPADCAARSTNPDPSYDVPILYEVPVVVHVIMNGGCTAGDVPDPLVESQIEILNEDFRALFGTNGGAGNDVGVKFVLADTDPQGNPTNGITRSCNTNWYWDIAPYWSSLAWDPHRYLNIYTNTAFGALGYVPFLPADFGGANVGTTPDRVVILWSTFGRNAPYGPPYHQGRTTTHEVGHWLGLEHPFTGGCADATPPGCYTSGDLICDTSSEQRPTYSPCALGAKSTCGSVDPSDNYMDYSDDLCMMRFTEEQKLRMRCTLESYRTEAWREAYGLFGPSPGQVDATNTWTVSGAAAGATQTVLFGSATGTTAVPNCPGVEAGIAAARPLGSAVADADGIARVERFAPQAASGRTYYFQALDESTCALSDVAGFRFP